MARPKHRLSRLDLAHNQRVAEKEPDNATRQAPRRDVSKTTFVGTSLLVERSRNENRSTAGCHVSASYG